MDGQRLITQSVYEKLGVVATVKRLDMDRLRGLRQASKPMSALCACVALLRARMDGYCTLYLAPHSGAGDAFAALLR